MFNKKTLIIGSFPHLNKPQTFGGTTVLMQNFAEYLKSFKIITANKFSFKGAFVLNFIYLFFKLFFKIPFYNKIMINAASNGAFLISPIIFLLSKVFRKKFIFRMFGGNLVELIQSKNKVLVWFFFQTVLKSDLIFVETKQVLKYVSNFNTNVFWFPNVRCVNQKPNAPNDFKKRFVFISHIKKTKGVGEIIKVFESLDKTYNVDLFGPVKDDVLHNISLTNNVNYKGTLKPNEVIKTLNNYDVLLLPTYHEGEGYPGIIVESFSQGIPVVSTVWKAIPELVDEYSGILVAPRSVKELKSAVLHFNKNNYEQFSLNAKNKFNYFNSEIVNKRIITIINKL